MVKKPLPKIAEDKPSGPSVSVVPIGSLVADPANVRKRGDRAKSNLVSSLKQFGPARSAVRSNGVIRAGNGTLEAFIASGGTEALIVKPEPGQLVVVDRDDWTNAEATAYSIQDNQSATLATWDGDGLLSQIDALSFEGVTYTNLGFEQADLDSIKRSLVSVQPDDPPKEPERKEDRADRVCPQCGFSLSGQQP